jgi:hypothetical protein
MRWRLTKNLGSEIGGSVCGAGVHLVPLELEVKTAASEAEFASGPGNVALVLA